MMTVTPYNICQGPGDLYYAVFGTVDPADSTATVVGGAPAAPFVGIGGTETGIMAEVDATYTDVKVDQVVDPVGARMTDRSITIKTQMKELTLGNLALSMNATVTQTVTGSYTALELQNTSSATQPQYSVIVFDGWAPTLASSAPARRRFLGRKVLSKPKVQLNAEKAKSGVYDVTFQCYWVANNIGPFRITDQTA